MKERKARYVPDLEDIIKIAGMCGSACLEEADYAQECSPKGFKPKVFEREDYYTNFSDVTSPRR